MSKLNINDLTKEQLAMAMNCETPEELIELAKSAHMSILSLGDRILRTETAAITAMSILMYEFNFAK